MATITKTIGTSSRDYSTIQAWEDDLDDTGIYSSGDDAVGECYDDSDFALAFTFNGGGTVGLASATLQAADGERHDGTAGSGVRMTGAGEVSMGASPSMHHIFQWIEIDAASNKVANEIVYIADGRTSLRNCIIHNADDTTHVAYGIYDFAASSGDDTDITGNVIYDIHGDEDIYGIYARSVVGDDNIANNTVHDIYAYGATGSNLAQGFSGLDAAPLTLRNNLITGVVSDNGTATCFPTFSTANLDHNASSDATAAGTGSLTNLTIADQYVSTVAGSEDLHLKSGSDCIGAGADLGTTPGGVEIDIDGRDRDAEGDTWDIGAHQFISAVVANTTNFFRFFA